MFRKILHLIKLKAQTYNVLSDDYNKTKIDLENYSTLSKYNLYLPKYKL